MHKAGTPQASLVVMTRVTGKARTPSHLLCWRSIVPSCHQRHSFRPLLSVTFATMLFTQPAALAPILYLLFALSAASTLTPPVLPLVVRSPYLSTWLGNARAGMGSTDSHCGSVL